MLTLDKLIEFYKKTVKSFVDDMDNHESMSFTHTVKYDSEHAYHNFMAQIDDSSELEIYAVTINHDLKSLSKWEFCHNLRGSSGVQRYELSSDIVSDSILLNYIARPGDYETRMRLAVNDVMSGMRW